LDTLDKDKFTLITRRLGFDNVINSIHKAIELGVTPVKVNCVVMKGINDYEVVDFVRWAQKEPIQVRFIEYMPFDGNHWTDTKFVSYTDMIKNIRAAGFPIERESDRPNETSKTYSAPGMVGSIGFISSMSEHFCGTCNRLRLLADGALKVCLFGQNEISLRDEIRNGKSDIELKEIIQMAVRKKKPSHDGMLQIDNKKEFNRPMVKIGG